MLARQRSSKLAAVVGRDHDRTAEARSRPASAASRNCAQPSFFAVRFGIVPRCLAPEDMLNGHEHDAQVEADRPALDVVEIVLDCACAARFGRASRAPGPSRSCRRGRRGGGRSRARCSRNSATKLGRSGLGPTSPMSPLMHVEELRQLVDVGVPEPVADPGAAAVVIRGPDRAGLAFGVGAHAAELDDAEEPAPLPHAFLGIEDRAPGGDQNGHGHERQREAPARSRRRRRSSYRSFASGCETSSGGPRSD